MRPRSRPSAARLLEREDAPSLRRVFNLTGTVLHTNLGRALLPESAIAAAVDAMRSRRRARIRPRRRRRAASATTMSRPALRADRRRGRDCVVNNNAAAVLLVLNTLAPAREAIVSRGELIEIGGAFRLPDIMARAGARLRRGRHHQPHASARTTRPRSAPDTGADPEGAYLATTRSRASPKSVPAARAGARWRARTGLPFVDDLGSGTLVDLARWGLPHEPTVREALAEGADLVTFSGDKLLGGPQAGLIVGRKELIARIAKNPMKRALRLDKIRLAALEASLKLYRDPDRLAETLPTLRYFARPQAEIAAGRARLRQPIAGARRRRAIASTSPIARSQIGSGALPLETLPSAGLAIAPVGRKGARPPAGGAGRGVPRPADSGDRPHQGRRADPRPALPRRRGPLSGPARAAAGASSLGGGACCA